MSLKPYDGAQKPRRDMRRKAILVVLGALVLFGALFLGLGSMVLKSREASKSSELSPSVAAAIAVLPDGNILSAPEGTVDRTLSDWLEGESREPHVFELGDHQFSDDAVEPQAVARSHLPSFVTILKAYPKVSVEIIGYTSRRSDSSRSVRTSTARAKWLRDYLAQAGIADRRLSYRSATDGERATDQIGKARLLVKLKT